LVEYLSLPAPHLPSPPKELRDMDMNIDRARRWRGSPPPPLLKPNALEVGIAFVRRSGAGRAGLYVFISKILILWY